MATARQIVAKAASQIGTKESPAKSNKTKYGKWFGMNGQPWCDMFVSWCAAQVGAGKIVGKFAYTPSHAAWFKKQGAWLGRTTRPKAGDIVFFANSKRICHVGIVEKRISASKVQTIEGNTSVTSNDNGGAVMRRTRTLGTVGSSWYIAGYARPKYAAKATETASKPASKQALAVDGYWGRKTTTALQKLLGTKPDGIVSNQAASDFKRVNAGGLDTASWRMGRGGSDVIRALQKRCGVKADGYFGAKSCRALQKRLKVATTGRADKTTVRALQRAINARKL